jgi:hypothetical protein
VVADGGRAVVIKQQMTGITVAEFLRLLAELRQALSTVDLDPDIARSVEADLQVTESQTHKPEPNRILLLLKLKSIVEMLDTADGVWGITEKVLPLAQQVLEWGRQLFS